MKPTCPLCGSKTFEKVLRAVTFDFAKTQLTCDAEFWRCGDCENELAFEDEARSNLRAANRAKIQYLGYPTAESISAWRERWGLNRRVAGRLLGVGPTAFSKYENAALIPSAPTAKLIATLIESDDATMKLARQSRIALEAPPSQSRETRVIRQPKVLVWASVASPYYLCDSLMPQSPVFRWSSNPGADVRRSRPSIEFLPVETCQ